MRFRFKTFSISGNHREFTLEQRLLNFGLFFSTLAVMASFVINPFVGIETGSTLGISIFGIPLIIGYFFSRFKKKILIGSLVITTCTTLCVFYLYLSYEGIRGTAPFYFLGLTCYLIVIFPSRNLKGVFGYIMGFYIVMVVFELFFPQYIRTYDDTTSETVSRAVSILMCYIFVPMFFLSFKRNYETEQRKVMTQNDIIIQKNHELEQIAGELQQKNQALHDSLEYAKGIQNAILPLWQNVLFSFPESFIIYRPKDIISGDMYWLHEREDKLFFACIDCTGHGVPGAFMSIIAHELLNKVVLVQNNNNPSDILEQLHIETLLTLKTQTTHQADGMDISFFVYDKKTMKLRYASAHQPFMVVRNGEVTRYKGTAKSIGSLNINKTVVFFTTEEIDIDPNTYLYLYTDGFVDQLQMQTHHKFSSNRLRELLTKIHTLPLETQKHILARELDEWSAGCDQTDDVLMWGIKLV